MPSISQSCRPEISDSEISVVFAGEGGAWQQRFQLELQTDGFSIAHAPSPAQVFAHKQRHSVLFADQHFLTGLELANETAVLELGRVVPILAVTMQDNPDVCAGLLRLGCSGIVSEGIEPSLLRRAVRRTACGELWASRQLLSKLLKAYLLRQGPETLTMREGEILGMIASGLSNRQIAEKLFISRETVRWHIRSLYAKTGACDRASLISYCSTHGAALPRKHPSKAASRGALLASL